MESIIGAAPCHVRLRDRDDAWSVRCLDVVGWTRDSAGNLAAIIIDDELPHLVSGSTYETFHYGRAADA